MNKFLTNLGGWVIAIFTWVVLVPLSIVCKLVELLGKLTHIRLLQKLAEVMTKCVMHLLKVLQDIEYEIDEQ